MLRSKNKKKRARSPCQPQRPCEVEDGKSLVFIALRSYKSSANLSFIVLGSYKSSADLYKDCYIISPLKMSLYTVVKKL